MTRPTAEIQMIDFPKRPIPDCYWVQPNLCASEYSGAPQGELARLKLRRLLACQDYLVGGRV